MRKSGTSACHTTSGNTSAMSLSVHSMLMCSVPRIVGHSLLVCPLVKLLVVEGYGECLEVIAGVAPNNSGDSRGIEAPAQVGAHRHIGPQA